MGVNMNWKNIDRDFYYEENDLGSIYTKESTSFRVWAPTANCVALKLYQEGLGDCLLETLEMQQDIKGTWYAKVERDLSGIYYTYSVTIGEVTNEVVDIYAKAAGANGKRGMVVDLERTNPIGWKEDKKPVLEHMNDTILYELHVRDLSMDKDAGIKQAGKYLGLVETGTKSPEGLATGLDHIKELGVTHVHLLPLHDYASIDEEHLEEQAYNWGYDPMNYNVPEGSYATDPFHGEVRIKEFKQAIQTFHENNLRVVMDVVYNHTFANHDSYFNKTVPDYYYRVKDGVFSNGSGCGNETASDHKMMQKFIVESICYWAKEYHIDGFRFDLMAVHDIETMNKIKEAVEAIDPTIILYGEGWTGGPSLLKAELSAKKTNAKKMPGIAMFNDDIRDAVKGHVFYEERPGFVNGLAGEEEKIKFSVVGAVKHPQIKKIKSWALTPTQSINYVSAHDDLTLWDKFAISNPQDSEEERKKMNKLAAAIVFTAQGIPFIQAGEEMLKTKPSAEAENGFDNNSYKSPDSINSIKWSQKAKEKDMVEYYKGLITFRKEHSALRMRTEQEVQTCLKFLTAPKNVVAYTIDKLSKENVTEKIGIIYNANKEAVTITMPAENWKVYVNGEKAGNEVLAVIKENTITVPALSAMVLVNETILTS